jgi:pilus assembly protein CpaF
VAEMTDPREAVRLRVEHALTAEDVDLTTPHGRERTEQLIEEMLASYLADALNGQAPELDSDERLRIARELRDDFVGLGALAERMLKDEEAQEWMINGPHQIWRDDGRRIARVTSVDFDDDEQVRRFLDRLLEQVEGRHLDRITPCIEARLPDGSRLSAAIPPVSSNRHVIASIRLFKLVATSLDELVELSFLSQQAADFLRACVRAEKNIVVSGRVSAGKTTLLNALGRAIPGTERVVVCESSAELQLADVLPNCIGYEARLASHDGLSAITLDELISRALRMNPDRLIVGECREGETWAMLRGLASGHAGMTSVHGESAEHALENLARLALSSGRNIDAAHINDWLRDVHVVVHCNRPRSFEDGERRLMPRVIDEIIEVQGAEGTRMTRNPLFTGAGAKLEWAGTSPAFLDDLESVGYQEPQ